MISRCYDWQFYLSTALCLWWTNCNSGLQGDIADAITRATFSVRGLAMINACFFCYAFVRQANNPTTITSAWLTVLPSHHCFEKKYLWWRHLTWFGGVADCRTKRDTLKYVKIPLISFVWRRICEVKTCLYVRQTDAVVRCTSNPYRIRNYSTIRNESTPSLKLNDKLNEWSLSITK